MKILCRSSYTVGYCTQRKAPLWCTYYASALRFHYAKSTPRPPFLKDPSLSADDRRSETKRGLDRGHLAPHCAVAIHDLAAREAMYEANITPQYAAFNRVTWRRLERLVQSFAVRQPHVELVVTVGPVFRSAEEVETASTSSPKLTSEEAEDSLPVAYFLSVLDPRTKHAVGYLLPHDASDCYQPDIAATAALPMTLRQLEERIAAFRPADESPAAPQRKTTKEKEGRVHRFPSLLRWSGNYTTVRPACLADHNSTPTSTSWVRRIITVSRGVFRNNNSKSYDTASSSRTTRTLVLFPSLRKRHWCTRRYSDLPLLRLE